MTRRHKQNVGLSVAAFFVAMIFVGLIALAVMTNGRSEVVAEEKPSIPELRLSLNGVTLAEINAGEKSVKYGGNNLEIFYDGVTNSYDDVEIKGRGNFSWRANKKSYRIKFDEKVDLFGMGKKKKWALVANSVDDSLMRNDLAYFMSDTLGGVYPAEGKFVELYVDNEDIGVYYLVKTMEIDKRVVDLREMDGILMEVDNAYCESEEKWWRTNNGDCFTVKDVVTEDIETEVAEEFVGDYNKFLVALSERDYETVNEIIDVKSFAKYFLFSELTADPDAYVTSWYMYRDGFSDKIHAGPVWDFDAAFGNKSWEDWPEGFYEPTTMFNRFSYMYGEDEKRTGVCKYDKRKNFTDKIDSMSWVVCDLLEMPEFDELVRATYVEEFADKKEVILKHIEETADEISEFAKKDARIWEKGDFDSAVEYLSWWVNERFERMNEFILRDV